MTVLCAANTFSSCSTLVLQSRMTEVACLEQVNKGIDKVLLTDGKWYETGDVKFSCVREY